MKPHNSKPFIFKQFVIRQDKCAMKVGTDSLLLGAWVKANEPKKILDIGTGTGILALMMAQKYPLAKIDAVEIDENAYRQAAENVLYSKFAQRIDVHHCSFQHFQTRETYDLIITNPPYFYHSKASAPERRLARHAESLPFEDILKKSISLLAEEGIFSLVLPIETSHSFIYLAQGYGLYCYQQCNVRTVQTKSPKRCLLSFSKKVKPFFQEELTLQDHPEKYTEEYKLLTNEFLIVF
ncbi:MAG: methyltransferase [Flammeovirgaceae bacterium]|nr:methyltransferase [Flammeovirgaceae bacterium]MDW8287116.1 methyltransferase [Flammeovirgaceae bacterium]